MLAMLSMAVGTGNIWRFPRIAAKNGGGEFLVAWVVFLFLWSVPLILLEFGMARRTRAGSILSFVTTAGPKWAWAGAFIMFVSTAITCYYSVVAGWTARYAVAAIGGELSAASVPGQFWAELTSSHLPLVGHAAMIGFAAVVVAKGVTAIERVAKVLMPVLLLLIGMLVVRAVTLPGAADGLAFLFRVDWSELTRARIWIEALTQNAWDTGAGWGLVLCYAAYQRRREDTALNGFLLPAANNMVSLLAGIMVFSTVFSAVPGLMERAAVAPENLSGLQSLQQAVQDGREFSTELVQDTVFSENNQGITFVWMPELFRAVPHSRFFMSLFFVALAVAAFTSLVSMLEVTVRAFVDAGFRREKAILGIAAGVFAVGVPPALSMKVFDNQDWTWGVALILCGVFFALVARRYGVGRLRTEGLNHKHSDIHVGRWWETLVRVVVPAEAAVLTCWLLYQAWADNPEGWLLPFDPDNAFNVGTVLFQVGLAALILYCFNRKIAASVQREGGAG